VPDRFSALACSLLAAAGTVGGFGLRFKKEEPPIEDLAYTTLVGRSVTMAVRRTLEAGWEVFIDENGGAGPGVRLRKPQRTSA
jgi:hypothetical protein